MDGNVLYIVLSTEGLVKFSDQRARMEVLSVRLICLPELRHGVRT